MYAKNATIPPKFDYPYQSQQRYSGSFIYAPDPTPPKALPKDTLEAITESAKRLTPAD